MKFFIVRQRAPDAPESRGSRRVAVESGSAGRGLDATRGHVGRAFLGLVLAFSLTAGLVVSTPSFEVRAQEVELDVPFQPGEALDYRVTSSRFGEVGTGHMTVTGPVRIRDRSALLLSLTLKGEVAFFDFEDETRSWFDPWDMTSLRFMKVEDHPFGGVSEEVEVYPEEGRWTDRDGTVGSLITKRPLDELSMIYLLRTLEMGPNSQVTLSRHFDPDRNPVRIAFLGTEEISVPAGTFEALAFEMTVRDERRYGEEGKRIRIHLTDDPARLPLKIESGAPMLGNAVLELEHVNRTARLAEGRTSAASIERSNR